MTETYDIRESKEFSNTVSAFFFKELSFLPEVIPNILGPKHKKEGKGKDPISFY